MTKTCPMLFFSADLKGEVAVVMYIAMSAEALYLSARSDHTKKFLGQY